MCKLSILCDWLVTESRDKYFNTIPQQSGMVEALFGFKSTQQKKFNLLWWILLKPVQHEKSRQINVGTLYCTMTLCDIEQKRKARSNGWIPISTFTNLMFSDFNSTFIRPISLKMTCVVYLLFFILFSVVCNFCRTSMSSWLIMSSFSSIRNCTSSWISTLIRFFMYSACCWHN